MPRGGDYLAVTGQFKAWERLPVDLGIGDYGGHIIPRVLASLLREVDEIFVEVVHHLHKVFQFKRSSRIGVAPTKEFLGKFEHEGLIFLRDAQYGHDDAQGIPDRHILDEVAFTPEIFESVHILGRKLGNLGFKPTQVLSKEPCVSKPTIVAVIGVVHLHQRSDEVPSSGHGFNEGL